MLLLETRHVPFQPLALSALRALVKHSKIQKNLAGHQLRGMVPARGTCPIMGSPNCCLWGLSITLSKGCILLSPCHKHTHSQLLFALRMEALYFSPFILLILAQEKLVPPAAHGMLTWVPESRGKPWLSSKQRTGSGSGGSWQPLQAQTSLCPLPSTLHQSRGKTGQKLLVLCENCGRRLRRAACLHMAHTHRIWHASGARSAKRRA